MRILAVALILLGALVSSGASAELVVIVHPDSQVLRLDRAQLINIYMGRYRQLPSGQAALPVDLAPLKARFYRALVNKDLAGINSYWARLVFSGQVPPPRQLQSTASVLEYVRRYPGALGFIDGVDAPADLRVVARLPEVTPP